jgi:flagellin
MALSIATNTGALMAAASAASVNKDMETSMERLSTGKRINSASDDAAGVAIASRLSSEIRGTNQAIRNAQDGQALINTAEGAHKEVENILQRMRELAVQSSNDTNDSNDRTNLQSEMRALTTEIDRIASTTSWAGQGLLTGSGGNNSNGTFNLQVGGNTGAGDTLNVRISAMTTTALGNGAVVAAGTAVNPTSATVATGAGTFGSTVATNTLLMVVPSSVPADFKFDFTVGGATVSTSLAAADTAITAGAKVKASLDAAGITNLAVAIDNTGKMTFTTANGTGAFDISTRAGATAAIDLMDSAIGSVNSQRARLGAVSNRLDNTVSNLTNISINLEGGRGRIEDADFAAESTSLAKSQILQQASTAMLAQANASKQNVLSLLQG